MHTIQLVNVVAESRADAATVAEGCLYSMEAPWFDWFEVGGRWDGFFGEHGNVLDVSAEPDVAVRALESVRAAQDAAFREGMARVAGRSVLPGDGPAEVLGLPVDPERWAAKTTEQNAASAAVWQRILSAGSLSELRSEGPLGPAPFLAWQVTQTLKLLTGEWTPDSGFFSFGSEWTSDPSSLIAAVSSGSAHGQFLVSVDFHF